MVQYSDIHLQDLKNLSVKSFTQVLINDVYPLIFNELTRLEDCLSPMKADYDTELLDSTLRKVYSEFDELYRKEKLVLFPFIIQLDSENTKAENCTPFKNIKVHYTSMVHHIVKAQDIIANFFITADNQESLDCMRKTLYEIRDCITETQYIKEKHIYPNFKSCLGCRKPDSTL
jgi:iron-sulfur cluster repair protein YtfE (RIC family)